MTDLRRKPRRSRLGIAIWRLEGWFVNKCWALGIITRSLRRNGIEGTAVLIDTWTAVKDAPPTDYNAEYLALSFDGDVLHALFHNIGDDWCWNTPWALFCCKEDGTPIEKDWLITHYMRMPEDFGEYDARIEEATQ